MAIVVGRVRFLNVGPAGGAKLVLRDVTDGVDETFLLQPRISDPVLAQSVAATWISICSDAAASQRVVQVTTEASPNSAQVNMIVFGAGVS